MSVGALGTYVGRNEQVESITTMESAAENRLLDAVAIGLERPDHALGMAYLLGYVVECTLKAALGRVRNHPLAADLFSLVKTELSPSRDYHDITNLFIATSRARSTALRTLDPKWPVTIAAVAGNHHTSFRYKSVRIQAIALSTMLADVEWIVAHRAELWS